METTKYIAFLRGINIGGHNIKMERLRELFSQLGFADVRSYIQTGNIFFETTETDRAALARKIELHLFAALGYEVPTFLRTVRETTDEAELAFQQAEAEKDKEKAVGLYKKAIGLRPKYAEANLALARALADKSDNEGALKAIAAARKARPGYAEASAVEGRIYKAGDNEQKAIAAFKRSISEGKNFQPEAHTGLGLLYKEKAESSGAEGDFQGEKQYYILAAAELEKAAAQLSTAPDAITIYQLLGDCYERAKMYPQAVKVYEKFLRLFPDSSEASAVRSFIVQINKRLNGEQ